MEGVDLSWSRVPGSDGIAALIDNLAAGFDFLRPEKSVKALTQLYHQISAMPDCDWRNKKLGEVKDLIVQCSGLFIEATTQEHFAVQTDSVKINFTLNNRLGADAVFSNISVDEFDSAFSQSLSKNKNLSFSKTFLFLQKNQSLNLIGWISKKQKDISM